MQNKLTHLAALKQLGVAGGHRQPLVVGRWPARKGCAFAFGWGAKVYWNGVPKCSRPVALNCPNGCVCVDLRWLLTVSDNLFIFAQRLEMDTAIYNSILCERSNQANCSSWHQLCISHCIQSGVQRWCMHLHTHMHWLIASRKGCIKWCTTECAAVVHLVNATRVECWGEKWKLQRKDNWASIHTPHVVNIERYMSKTLY